MKNKIKINHQTYVAELFTPKPRIIKCNRCQVLGHVSRLCRSDHPVCGKCGATDHETRDCVVEEKDYKCVHCGGNHITGSYSCIKMKEQMEKLLNRQYV